MFKEATGGKTSPNPNVNFELMPDGSINIRFGTDVNGMSTDNSIRRLAYLFYLIHSGNLIQHQIHMLKDPLSPQKGVYARLLQSWQAFLLRSKKIRSAPAVSPLQVFDSKDVM